MNLLPLAILTFLIPNILLSQNKANQSIAIKYQLVLSEKFENSQKQYAAHSSFKEKETEAIVNGFVNHIKQNDQVKNYHSRPIETSLSFSNVSNKSNDFMIGGLAFDTSNFNDFLSSKEDSIYQNGKAIGTESNLINQISMVSIDPETGLEVETSYTENTNLKENFSGSNFIEEWTYNSENSVFNKAVKFASLNYRIKNAGTGKNETRAAFYFQTSNSLKSMENKEYLLKESVVYDVEISPGPVEEGCDIYANSTPTANYIEPSKRFKLIRSIARDIQNGKLKIHPYNVKEGEIAKYNPNNLKSAEGKAWIEGLSNSITEIMVDPQTGLEVEVEFTHEASLNEIVGLRFYEDWYIDSKEMAIKKKVKGIVLLSNEIDLSTGMKKDPSPITPFYISFE